MRLTLHAFAGVFLLLGLPLTLSAQGQREFQNGYRFFQNTSPEFLQIDVLQVEEAPEKGFFGGNSTRITASARVVDVIRSDSGLSNGQTISIQYRHAARVGNSAETPAILQAGKSYPAFLERKGDFYQPSARHLSFSAPSGVQMKVYEEARTRSREKQLAQTAALPDAPVIETKSPILTAPTPIPDPEPSPSEASAPSLSTNTENTPNPAPPVVTAADNPAGSPPPPTPGANVDSSQKRKTLGKTKGRLVEPIVLESVPTTDEKLEPSTLPTSKDEAVIETQMAPPAVEPMPQPEPIMAAPAAPEPPIRVETETPPTPVAPPAQPAPPLDAPQTNSPPPPQEEPISVTIPPPTKEMPETITEPAPAPKVSGKEMAAREDYAEIYGLIKEGESLQLEGKSGQARDVFTQAREKLLKLKLLEPDFQPFMVEYRLRDLEKKMQSFEKSPAPAPAEKP